jgi:hypothetical protein
MLGISLKTLYNRLAVYKSEGSERRSANADFETRNAA